MRTRKKEMGGIWRDESVPMFLSPVVVASNQMMCEQMNR